MCIGVCVCLEDERWECEREERTERCEGVGKEAIVYLVCAAPVGLCMCVLMG